MKRTEIVRIVNGEELTAVRYTSDRPKPKRRSLLERLTNALHFRLVQLKRHLVAHNRRIF